MLCRTQKCFFVCRAGLSIPRRDEASGGVELPGGSPDRYNMKGIKSTLIVYDFMFLGLVSSRTRLGALVIAIAELESGVFSTRS